MLSNSVAHVDTSRISPNQQPQFPAPSQQELLWLFELNDGTAPIGDDIHLHHNADERGAVRRKGESGSGELRRQALGAKRPQRVHRIAGAGMFGRRSDMCRYPPNSQIVVESCSLTIVQTTL